MTQHILSIIAFFELLAVRESERWGEEEVPSPAVYNMDNTSVTAGTFGESFSLFCPVNTKQFHVLQPTTF